MATCRSGDKAEEEEKEEAGDHQGGKTNLDIHRSGEQSPPGETMAVINKGWQSELSINRQTPSPASSEPISMLNKPTISFPWRMVLWDVSFAGYITIYISRERWMSGEGKLARITIICTRCWITSHHHQANFFTMRKPQIFPSLLLIHV